ncbi:MAG: hypothetical protein CL424_15295 [Acidimicrobiaceae bacterium]|nr:hypothetical protein [Acidimicrobiaceae bacterium]
MSFDPATGWTRLLANQVARYARRVDGRPDSVDERLEASGVDYYWDVYGGLHARCTSGRLWELLSGQPSKYDDEVSEPTDTEWIRVTDLGAVFEPVASTSTVLKLLREEGLLERRDRKDWPTQAAAGLYIEIEPVPAAGIPQRPGAVQRLWSYEVVVRLRARRSEVEAELSARPKPAPREVRPAPIKVRFRSTCAVCGRELRVGEDADWHPETKAVRCAACISGAAPSEDSQPPA